MNEIAERAAEKILAIHGLDTVYDAYNAVKIQVTDIIQAAIEKAMGEQEHKIIEAMHKANTEALDNIKLKDEIADLKKRLSASQRRVRELEEALHKSREALTHIKISCFSDRKWKGKDHEVSRRLMKFHNLATNGLAFPDPSKKEEADVG